MNNIFLNEKIKSLWTAQEKEIKEYYNAIEVFDFENAINAGNIIKSGFKSNEKESVLNDCYFFKTILCILTEYASYWEHINQNAYSKSWDILQNTQDYLRIINKFTKANSAKFFGFFENQLTYLEKIYPYNLFSSIEAVYGKVECSICGKNMDSFECPHIRGELYYGKVAIGIVKEIKHLCAVALVPDPCDKRCVIKYPESSPAFGTVRYLSMLVTEKKLNPLRFSHVEFSKIVIPKHKINNTGRNELCPCGSGKKYKRCCLGKELIQKDHVDIIYSRNNGILSDNLLHLT